MLHIDISEITVNLEEIGENRCSHGGLAAF